MMKIVKVFFKNNVFWGAKSLGDICKIMNISGFASFYPFCKKVQYIPKPALISDELLNLSLANHKYHRFMRYLAIPDIREYFGGSYAFAEKSNFSFGEYEFEDGVMKFTFHDQCGVYALIENMNDYSALQIKQIITEMIGNDNEIEIELDSMPDTFGSEGVYHFYILMNDLNTKVFSQIELEELLNQASYYVDYHNDSGVWIRAGACFMSRPSWLKNAMLLEVKV